MLIGAELRCSVSLFTWPGVIIETILGLFYSQKRKVHNSYNIVNCMEETETQTHARVSEQEGIDAM